MIQIQRVGHIAVNVRNLERSIAFYRDVLGLREVGRYGGNMVFFSATGENHHDIVLVEVGEDARPSDDRGVGFSHVAWKIGDRLEQLRAAKTHLQANNVAIRRMENHCVSQSIYLADPDGNELELYVDADPRIWHDDPSVVATVEPFEL